MAGLFIAIIGTWAGPNTVAQALRCRAKSDPNCNIVVHVAMDMLVVRQSINKECMSTEKRLIDEIQVEPLFSPRKFSQSTPLGMLLFTLFLFVFIIIKIVFILSQLIV